MILADYIFIGAAIIFGILGLIIGFGKYFLAGRRA